MADPTLDRSSRWILVAAVVVLPWLAIKYVPVAAVLAVAGLIRMRGSERTPVVLLLAAAGAVYVAGHLWIYGGWTPFATGDHFVGGEMTVIGTDVDLWGRATRLVGLWVDRGFGIAAWQPGFLLTLVAAGRWLRRREGAILVALATVGILVATFVALTMHGWWFPGRQLVVVLPVFVLMIAGWADRDRLRMGTATAMGLVGVVAFGFLAVEGLAGELTWVVDFGSTANPLYRRIAPLLPDYMSLTSGTWVRHGLWLAALIGLGIWGWIGGSKRKDTTSAPESGRRDTPILERA